MAKTGKCKNKKSRKGTSKRSEIKLLFDSTLTPEFKAAHSIGCEN